ncbi:MAG: UbiA family prenyltransferase [Dinoroseobacter sp.]|nr:UbiA family prenyltransferase [Dinoroseobacter sp.]
MVPDKSVHSDCEPPLALDVDGTLLRTDLLHETFWAALGKDVGATLRVAFLRLGSPAKLKRDLSLISFPAIELLPVNETIHARARKALAEGRSVRLVSGADQTLIDALAERLQLPGPHFASEPQRNLTGETKANLLRERFGIGQYDYAGNSHKDLPSWVSARKIIAVAPSTSLQHRLREIGKPFEIVAGGWTPRKLLRELRPHQWVKNLLLFVPLLAAHQFDPASFGQVALAAVAFSLGASAIYILNDLLDLDADRQHPTKCNRPIACGDLPIPVATAASGVLAFLALSLALAVGPPVAALTLLYMAGSLGYSLWLKKHRWLDVIALASLFLLRVLAGAVAADVATPPILLALTFVIFLALAWVKRTTALSRLSIREHLPGRGYSSEDLAHLKKVCYAAIAAAAILFLVYALGPVSAELYGNQVLLALAVIPLTLWLARIVRLSAAGLEDYDPVRFVLSDGVGLLIVLSGVAMIILAA